MMLCSLGRVRVISAWQLVVIMSSLSSLEYVLARAGDAAAACYCGGFAAAAV